jgi:hypothetical protein
MTLPQQAPLATRAAQDRLAYLVGSSRGVSGMGAPAPAAVPAAAAPASTLAKNILAVGVGIALLAWLSSD